MNGVRGILTLTLFFVWVSSGAGVQRGTGWYTNQTKGWDTPGTRTLQCSSRSGKVYLF